MRPRTAASAAPACRTGKGGKSAATRSRHRGAASAAPCPPTGRAPARERGGTGRGTKTEEWTRPCGGREAAATIRIAPSAPSSACWGPSGEQMRPLPPLLPRPHSIRGNRLERAHARAHRRPQDSPKRQSLRRRAAGRRLGPREGPLSRRPSAHRVHRCPTAVSWCSLAAPRPTSSTASASSRLGARALRLELESQRTNQRRQWGSGAHRLARSRPGGFRREAPAARALGVNRGAVMEEGKHADDLVATMKGADAYKAS